MKKLSRGRILEALTEELILRGTFEIQILPNCKQLCINVQCALLDMHSTMFLEELAHLRFLIIR